MGNVNNKNKQANRPGPDDILQINRDHLVCNSFLGRGCYGQVYLGEWRDKKRRKVVAIKQIYPNNRSNRVSTDRALREAYIQYNLIHRNIVPLHGVSFDATAGDCWIVMDFVEGTDLEKLIFPRYGNGNSLTFGQKVRIILDICSALAYIHSRGFIHRDVKPNNIMVNTSGKAFVCDFGITKHMGEKYLTRQSPNLKNEPAADDKYETWCPVYIPPECVQRDPETGRARRSTIKSDIWSVGVVVFEMFLEQPLDDYEDRSQLLREKKTNDNRLIKRRIHDLPTPKQIQRIVFRALNFQPSSRPTAQQLYGEFSVWQYHL